MPTHRHRIQLLQLKIDRIPKSHAIGAIYGRCDLDIFLICLFSRCISLPSLFLSLSVSFRTYSD